MREIANRRNRARSLRRRATEAEKELWRQFRAKLSLEGTYFRRQVPLGSYFADFACLKHRLVIELDGGQHGTEEGRTGDAARTRYLQQDGFRILGFWNHQVFTEINAVLDTIHAVLHETNRTPILKARETS